MSKFVLIDGNAMMHRAYHALPKTLRSPAGIPSNAVFGFTNILLGILEVEGPDCIAVAFDHKGPTFRHAEMVDYKGTRKKSDDDFIVQIPWVKRVVEALSIPQYEEAGLEADDFLGMVATRLIKDPKMNVVIVTNDQDALQLVNDQIKVAAPQSGYQVVKYFDRAAVIAKLGVTPEQVPDYKGLSGDSSDNIPGVPGIGPKKALDLLSKFGSVEGIYEHLEEVEPERVRELMRAHEDAARLCKRMATILRDGDFDIDLAGACVHEFDHQAVISLFNELGMKGPLLRVEKLKKHWVERAANEQQTSLF